MELFHHTISIAYKLIINYEELDTIVEHKKEFPKASLLLVTKNRPKTLIDELINKGFKLFGENRVQEAQAKFGSISANNLSLHLIGPLQTNKTKLALNLFDTIQSLDRPKLVREISRVLKKNTTVKTKEFYIQVNIGKEEQKSGISPESVKDFYEMSISENLNIIGLMCIPPFEKNSRDYFNKMNEIKESIDTKLKLSMGMSDDYKIALECNSDLIRIGSRIFK